MKAVNNYTFAPAYPDTIGYQNNFPELPSGSSIIVVGAGVFGSWMARFLNSKNYQVTLIDAHGPGNTMGSSGDNNRVIRSTYGGHAYYFDLNVRALQLWKQFEKEIKTNLFTNTGVLWLCHNEKTPIVDDSIPYAKKNGMDYEYLSREQIKKSYPFIALEDLHHAYYDSHGGFIEARKSCELVIQQFIKEKGIYTTHKIHPGEIKSHKMNNILTDNGTSLTADLYIFACGPWLGSIFPPILGQHIISTKQETYYFDVSERSFAPLLDYPVWVEADNNSFYYGIVDRNNKTFKIGVDKRGELIDPTYGERILTEKTLKEAKEFLAYRFPAIKDAILSEGKVCCYENSPDGNFIIDRHPEANNVLLVGGGSGHGFKHGPAVGEVVANAISGEGKISELFSLSRLA